MRKSIFKREIESCFTDFHISDSQQMDVLKGLFEDPVDVTKQYLLKKEIESTQNISDCLKIIVNNDGFISDVRSLFEVNDDLELPDKLREQLSRKQNIAVFVGAGVSKLLGIPLWAELSTQAITHLHKIGRITFSEAEKFRDKSISPKQVMSIFHNFLSKEQSKEFYEEQFTPEEKKLDKNPYDLLVGLEIPKFTSNLDHEFWNALEKHALRDEKKTKPIQFVAKFSKETPIISNGIYQVHGSYRNLENYSIITMRDYLSHYFQDTGLREFLKKLFNEYVVIFFGYGMEEFEILQDIIKSSKGHHVLINTYLNDTNWLRVRKEYFRKTLGVNAHGYYLDFSGHDRLYDVIGSWVKKINFELHGNFYQKTGEFGDVEL